MTTSSKKKRSHPNKYYVEIFITWYDIPSFILIEWLVGWLVGKCEKKPSLSKFFVKILIISKTFYKGKFSYYCSPLHDEKLHRLNLKDENNVIKNDISRLFDCGEKLYPHTSSDGREDIRQELKCNDTKGMAVQTKLIMKTVNNGEFFLLRSIGERWQQLSDRLASSINNLESCLFQLAQNLLGQEKLCKWFDEMNKAMAQNQGKKSTLMEKKAQLADQEALVQRIFAHKPEIDQIIEEIRSANHLDDSSVAECVVDLQQQCDELTQMAEDLLKQVKEEVDIYEHFEELCHDFSEKLQFFHEKFSDCKDVKGDKQSVQTRYDTYKSMKENMVDLEEKLKIIKSKFVELDSITNTHGQDHTKRTVESLEQDYGNLKSEVFNIGCNMENVLQQWKSYENNVNTLLKWFSETDTLMKDPQELCLTIEEKKAKLEIAEELEKNIIDYETKIDQFSDQSHALLHWSGNQQVKNKISQLNSRYQQLKQNIRDLVTKCTTIASDHKDYVTLLEKFTNIINNHEIQLEEIKDIKNIEDKDLRLSDLLSEQESGNRVLSNLLENGEKVLVCTASAGRDTIRKDLKNLQRHWEDLGANLSDMKKQSESKQAMWSTFTDLSNQVSVTILSWLGNMKKCMDTKKEKPDSMHDARAKQRQFKILNQEIAAYKKIINTLEEQVMSLNNSEANQTMSNILKQYKSLVTHSNMLSKDSDEKLALVQKYQGLHKSFTDWQKDMWERASQNINRSGNKKTLQNSLSKVEKIMSVLICAYKKYTVHPVEKISSDICFLRLLINILRRTVFTHSKNFEGTLELETIRIILNYLYTRPITAADYELFSLSTSIAKDDQYNVILYNKIKPKDTLLKPKLNLSKLEEELDKNRPEGEMMLIEVSNCINELKEKFPQHDSDVLDQDLESLKNDSNRFSSHIKDVEHELQEKLKQWKNYYDLFYKLIAWLSQKESLLKDYCPEEYTGRERATTLHIPGERSLLQEVEEEHKNLQDLQAFGTTLEKPIGYHRQTSEDDSGSDQPRSLDDSQSSSKDLPSAVSQICTRYQTLLLTAKDIVKKSKHHHQDHELFENCQSKCVEALNSVEQQCGEIIKLKGNTQQLQTCLQKIDNIVAGKRVTTMLLHELIETAEKTNQNTMPEGQKEINEQVEKLQQMSTSLYEQILNIASDLKTKADNIKKLNMAITEEKDWLNRLNKQLGKDDGQYLKATLDEKKLQMQTYRTYLHDLSLHQQSVNVLKGKCTLLPERDKASIESIDSLCNDLILAKDKIQTCTRAAQNSLVFENISTRKKVMLFRSLKILATFVNVSADVTRCTETSNDRLSINNNMEKLKDIEKNIESEDMRLNDIDNILKDIIDTTAQEGYPALYQEVEKIKNNWAAIVGNVQTNIAKLKLLLSQWVEYDNDLEAYQNWLRNTDANLQSSVLAKELEIDAFTDKMQQLQKQTTMRKTSHVCDLGIKYQQLVQAVKDQISKWLQYVSDHQNFEKKLQDCRSWITTTKVKLPNCKKLDGSMVEMEEKLTSIQEALFQKDEGFHKVQAIIEAGQGVLANTSPDGHKKINDAMSELQEDWSKIAAWMSEAKVLLEEHIRRWAGFMEQLQQLKMFVDEMQLLVNDANEFKTTLFDKKNIYEKLKVAEHKISMEKLELENLKAKAIGMTEESSDTVPDCIKQAISLLQELNELKSTVQNFLKIKENHYKDHQAFSHAYKDLRNWMRSAREKIPPLKESLCDQPAVESGISVLLELQAEKTEGLSKLDKVIQFIDVTLATTSDDGKVMINEQKQSMKKEFANLFDEIEVMKQQLDEVNDQLKLFKTEHELFTNWLQCIETELKEQRFSTKANIDEKQSVVDRCNELDKDLVKKGKDKLEQLKSHGEVLCDFNVGMDIVNSKYHAVVNLCKVAIGKIRDLTKRFFVRTDIALSFQMFMSEMATAFAIPNLLQILWQKQKIILAIHKKYKEQLSECKTWMQSANQQLSSCNSLFSNRDALQSNFGTIQELLIKHEEGQPLLHNVIADSEKTLRSTNNAGKEIVKKELQELQADWDSLVSKLSEAKVQLETSLLKWTDYKSSFTRLEEWLSEKEAYFRELQDQRITPSAKESMAEKRAKLRKINSLAQDVLSFNSMIESVNSKATELMCETKDNDVSKDMSDIYSKYKALSAAVQDYLTNQRTFVDQYQQYIDACNEMARWLSISSESLSRCAEATGDQDAIKIKINKAKALYAQLDDGLSKLRKVLRFGEMALVNCCDADRGIVDEEMGVMQQEYEQYKADLNECKTSLEVGLVKWNEYEERFVSCSEWLAETEVLVQSFMKLQPNLSGKKSQLEQFQQHLQSIFDWQNELDHLNMKAQLLLDTCSDSRISNAVTTLTTKYNALLSLSKEVMRRLEQHYQEHQQEQSLLSELCTWIEETKEKLKSCNKTTGSITDIQNRIETTKSLKVSLEHEQNKLRYLLELKEKVILNTDSDGAASINEDMENLQADFDKLLNEIAAVRGNLLERYRNVHRDIYAHKDLADKLRSKFKGDKPTEIQECLDKFEMIKNLVEGEINALEEQIKIHEQYKEAFKKITNWLNERKLCIKKASDFTTEKIKLDQNLASLISMNTNDFPTGEKLIENVMELGKKVQEDSGQLGQSVVESQLEQITNDWENVKSLADKTSHQLEECLSCWTDYEAIHSVLSEWLKLLTELESHQSDINDVNTKSSLLIELTGNMQVQDQTINLLSLHGSLESKIKDAIKKLQKTLTDHSEYEKAKKDLCEWLNNTNAKIAENMKLGESCEMLAQKRDILKGLFANLPDGEKCLSAVHEASAKALSTSPSDNKRDEIRMEVQDMRSKIDEIEQTLNESINRIAKILMDWQEFDEGCKNVEKSLKNAQNTLEKDIVPSPDIAEIKTQQDILKVGKKRIYTNVKNIMICYKKQKGWLLQQSFQLMSHNSLFIATLVETDNQLKQHLDVMQEIREFQQTIDKTKNKGQILIDKYKTEVKGYRVKIQEQIENIQSSYDYLKQNAINIRVSGKRLEESKIKFQEYEGALDHCEKILDDVEITLSEDVTFLTIEEAQKALASNKVLLKYVLLLMHFHIKIIQAIVENLNAQIISLQDAIQGCLEAQASLSRPSSPEALPASMMIPEREVNMKIRLEDDIGQAEERVVMITKMLNEWNMFSNEIEEMRQWLKNQQDNVEQLKNQDVLLSQESMSEKFTKYETLKSEAIQKQDAVDDMESKIQVLNPESDLSDLKEGLSDLITELEDLVIDASVNLSKLSDYFAMMKKIENQCKIYADKLDQLDKQDSLSCSKKIDLLKGWLKDLKSLYDVYSDLKMISDKILDILCENERPKLLCDVQAIEKIIQDLEKKIERKLQNAETILANYYKIYEKLKSLLSEIENKAESINKDVSNSYKIDIVKETLSSIKCTRNELDKTKGRIEPMSKQSKDMLPNLHPDEQDSVNGLLQNINHAIDKLYRLLNSTENNLSETLKDRECFEKTVENIEKRLKQALSSIPSEKLLPLTEKDCKDFVKATSKTNIEITEFAESNISELKKISEKVKKSCDDENRNAIDKLVKDLIQKVEDFKSKLENEMREQVQHSEMIKKLNEDFTIIKKLVTKTKTVFDNESHPTDVSSLNEMIKSLQKLLDESHKIKMGEVLDKVHQTKNKLSPADKLELDDRVQSISQQLDYNISAAVEKIKKLQEELQTLKAKEAKVQQLADKIKQISKDIDTSSAKSIGWTVDNAKDAFEKSEVIFKCFLNTLMKVNELYSDTKDLQTTLPSNYSNLVNDLEAITYECQEATNIAEAQRLKTKKAIDDRQMFQKTITEVTTEITEITETLKTKSMLATARNKGDVIGAEGSLSDRNKIIEMLQGLKNQLGSLRSNIEKIKSQHEATIAEQQKFSKELNTLLDCLDKADSNFKSYPLLSLSVESVEEEISKLKEKYLKGAKTARQNLNSKLSAIKKKFIEVEKDVESLQKDLDFEALENQVITDQLGGLKQHLEDLRKLHDNNVESIKMYLKIWKEYCSLIDKVQDVLASSNMLNDMPVALNSIKLTLDVIDKLLSESHQNEKVMEQMVKISKEICEKANSRCRSQVQEKVSDMKLNWKNFNQNLSEMNKSLKSICDTWEDFNDQVKVLENDLTKFEIKLQDIEEGATSFLQMTEVLEQLTQLVAEVNLDEEKLSTAKSLSEVLLVYLKSTSQPSEKSQQEIEELVDSLITRFEKLISTIQQRITWIQDDLKYLDKFDADVSALHSALKDIESEISGLDVYNPDEEQVINKLNDVKARVCKICSDVKDLSQKICERYKSRASPPNITKQLQSLEIFSESVSEAMNDKESGFNEARKSRWDFKRDVEELSLWIQQSLDLLEDNSMLPQPTRDALQDLTSEVPEAEELLRKIAKAGAFLVNHSSINSERELMKDTVASLTNELGNLQSQLTKKNVLVSDALDAWNNFSTTLNAIKEWMKLANDLLNSRKPLKVLVDVRQRLSAINGVLKDHSHIHRQLVKLGKEVKKILEACSAGELPEKVTETEQEVSDLENQLQEQSALLQEMIEEWEQCQQKLNEVSSWLDQTNSNMGSAANKQKSLRDQLLHREKILADITVMRTKILMSMEKLNVHFKSRPNDNIQIKNQSDDLLQKLSVLKDKCSDEVQNLDKCLEQHDDYSANIQKLRSMLSNAELQMRTLSSPSITQIDQQKKSDEQNAFLEQSKKYRNQIDTLNNKIKQLNQRKVPDPDPFKLKIDFSHLNVRPASPRICLSRHASISSLDSDSGLKTSFHSDVLSDSADNEVAQISTSAEKEKSKTFQRVTIPKISISDQQETDSPDLKQKDSSAFQKPPLPPKASTVTIEEVQSIEKVQSIEGVQSIEEVQSAEVKKSDYTFEKVPTSPTNDIKPTLVQTSDVSIIDKPSYADVASGRASPHPISEELQETPIKGPVLLSKSELSSFHSVDPNKEKSSFKQPSDQGNKLAHPVSSSDQDTSEPTSPVSLQSTESSSQSSYFVPIIASTSKLSDPVVVQTQKVTVHQGRAPDGSATISHFSGSYAVEKRRSYGGKQATVRNIVSETVTKQETRHEQTSLTYADIARKSASCSDSGSEDTKKNVTADGRTRPKDPDIRKDSAAKKQSYSQNQKNVYEPLPIQKFDAKNGMSRGFDSGDVMEKVENLDNFDSDATLLASEEPVTTDPQCLADEKVSSKQTKSEQKTKKKKRSKKESSHSTTDDEISENIASGFDSGGKQPNLGDPKQKQRRKKPSNSSKCQAKASKSELSEKPDNGTKDPSSVNRSSQINVSQDKMFHADSTKINTNNINQQTLNSLKTDIDRNAELIVKTRSSSQTDLQLKLLVIQDINSELSKFTENLENIERNAIICIQNDEDVSFYLSTVALLLRRISHMRNETLYMEQSLLNQSTMEDEGVADHKLALYRVEIKVLEAWLNNQNATCERIIRMTTFNTSIPHLTDQIKIIKHTEKDLLVKQAELPNLCRRIDQLKHCSLFSDHSRIIWAISDVNECQNTLIQILKRLKDCYCIVEAAIKRIKQKKRSRKGSIMAAVFDHYVDNQFEDEYCEKIVVNNAPEYASQTLTFSTSKSKTEEQFECEKKVITMYETVTTHTLKLDLSTASEIINENENITFNHDCIPQDCNPQVYLENKDYYFNKECDVPGLYINPTSTAELDETPSFSPISVSKSELSDSDDIKILPKHQDFISKSETITCQQLPYKFKRKKLKKHKCFSCTNQQEKSECSCSPSAYLSCSDSDNSSISLDPSDDNPVNTGFMPARSPEKMHMSHLVCDPSENLGPFITGTKVPKDTSLGNTGDVKIMDDSIKSKVSNIPLDVTEVEPQSICQIEEKNLQNGFNPVFEPPRKVISNSEDLLNLEDKIQKYPKILKYLMNLKIPLMKNLHQ
ncbi:Nesprin-1 [Nymphon striatum]|nr:Nesprin-1 [Nymphon striatum]